MFALLYFHSLESSKGYHENVSPDRVMETTFSVDLQVATLGENDYLL